MGKMKTFKIKNRKGFAAICCGCITEGRTPEMAKARMEKALRRVTKRKGCCK